MQEKAGKGRIKKQTQEIENKKQNGRHKPSTLIITLNVNGLNDSIKRQRLSG